MEDFTSDYPVLSNDLNFNSYIQGLNTQLNNDYLEQEIVIDGLDSLTYIILGYNQLIATEEDYEVRSQIIKEKCAFLLNTINQMHSVIFANNPEDKTYIINFDEDNQSSLVETATTLYHFLYLNRYKNVVNFFCEYIQQNKKSLIQTYKSNSGEDKGLTLLRQAISDGDKLIDHIVSYGLVDIIDLILSDDIQYEMFIKFMTKGQEDRIDNFVILNDDFFNLSPSFIHQYITGVINDSDTYPFFITNVSTHFQK